MDVIPKRAWLRLGGVVALLAGIAIAVGLFGTLRLPALVSHAARPASLEAACPGAPFALTHVPGGLSPYIRLRVGDVTGAFLLDYAAEGSSLSQAAFPAEGGNPRRLDVQLPGFAFGIFPLRPYFLTSQPAGGLAGVIGTDFLSLLNVRLTQDTAFIGAAPCAADALRDSGFLPIAQGGFFTSSPSPGARYPNVPVVYLGLGGLHVWAQVDTGYDGLDRRVSVDINQPLFDRLVARGVLLRETGAVTISTCAGAERRQVYEAPGLTLAVENEAGTPIAGIQEFRLLLKPRNACGGIADFDIPAAQLDASILKYFDQIVFDPRHAAVWVHGAAAGLK